MCDIKLVGRVKHFHNPLQKYQIWGSLQFILQSMYKYTFTASEENILCACMNVIV
jgi:hypothetical protein